MFSRSGRERGISLPQRPNFRPTLLRSARKSKSLRTTTQLRPPATHAFSVDSTLLKFAISASNTFLRVCALFAECRGVCPASETPAKPLWHRLFFAVNSRSFRTYRFADSRGLKIQQNQHLRETTRGAAPAADWSATRMGEWDHGAYSRHSTRSPRRCHPNDAAASRSRRNRRRSRCPRLTLRTRKCIFNDTASIIYYRNDTEGIVSGRK